MNISHLQLSSFRNYSELDLLFPPEGAIFEGINGSGKTNILESIYLLCTGRSQRGAKRSEMISFNAQNTYLEGDFSTGESTSTKASMGFSREKKIVLNLNGKQISSFSEWFGQRPVISFGSDDLSIINGSPEHRRRFIDILGSQTDNEYLMSLMSYKHFLSCRNKLLSNKIDNIQCEIYEEKMAETGSDLFIKRKEIFKNLRIFFGDFYKEISDNREVADVMYVPSIHCDSSSKKEWKNVFYSVLNESRKKDIETGFSSLGPHRDDIRFFLDQKSAKTFGSQGQCRSIALSLKLSSILCIETYRQDGMIFLVDDAVSELDKYRTSKVYPLIENKGQIFIATPVFDSLANKSLLRCIVADGKVVKR